MPKKDNEIRGICSVLTKKTSSTPDVEGCWYLMDVMADVNNFIFDFKILNLSFSREIGTYNVDFGKQGELLSKIYDNTINKHIFWFEGKNAESEMKMYYEWVNKTIEI